MCRKPCIGVKQVNNNGIVFKRFQISLINEVTSNFDTCCTMLRGFNFQIKIKDNMNETKAQSQQNNGNIQSNDSQIVQPIQSISDTQMYPLIQPASQIPIQLPSQNMASCFSSFSTQPLQPPSQIIEPQIYQLFSQPGHVMHQGKIPETTNKVVSTNLTIDATTQTLPRKLQSVFLDDINELKKISNSCLRSVIRTLLHLKDFLDLIDRLDKIITDI